MKQTSDITRRLTEAQWNAPEAVTARTLQANARLTRECLALTRDNNAPYGPGTVVEDLPEEYPVSTTVLYRLYTEDNGNLSRIIDRYFSAATIISARGLWKGVGEQSAIIEIIANPSEAPDIDALVQAICRENVQESVLVVSIPVTSSLVSRREFHPRAHEAAE